MDIPITKYGVLTNHILHGAYIVIAQVPKIYGRKHQGHSLRFTTAINSWLLGAYIVIAGAKDLWQ